MEEKVQSQIDAETIQLTIQQDILDFRKKYDPFLVLLDQADNEETQYQQKQKLDGSIKQREHYISQFVQEINNDLKLLGLTVFAQIFGRIVKSMRKESDCIQNYYERVVMSQKQNGVHESENSVKDVDENQEQSTVDQNGQQQVKKVQIDMNYINHLKQQIKNQDYMIEIRTNAIMEKDKYIQDLEYKLEKLNIQHNNIQYINTNLVEFTMKLNKNNQKQLPFNINTIIQEDSNSAKKQKSQQGEQLTYNQKESILGQINQYFYDLIFNGDTISEEMKSFLKQQKMAKSNDVMSKYADLIAVNKKQQNDVMQIDRISSIDFNKISHQFSEIFNKIKKSNDKMQIQILENKGNQIEDLLNKILMKVRSIVQQFLGNQKNNSWSEMNTKEQMKQVSSFESEFLKLLRIRMENEQQNNERLFQYLKTVESNYEQFHNREKETNFLVYELNLKVQSSQVVQHKMKEKNIILNQKYSILNSECEGLKNQIDIYQQRIEDLIDKLDKLKNEKNSTFYLKNHKSLSKQMINKNTNFEQEKTTKTNNFLNIENQSLKIIMKKQNNRILELENHIENMNQLIDNLNKKINKQKAKHEIEQQEKSPSITIIDEKQNNQEGKNKYTKLNIESIQSGELIKHKAIRQDNRQPEIDVNEKMKKSNLIMNEIMEYHKQNAIKPFNVQQQQGDYENFLNFVYLNFQMDNQVQVNTLKKLFNYFSFNTSLNQQQFKKVNLNISQNDQIYIDKFNVCDNELSKLKKVNKNLLRSISTVNIGRNKKNIKVNEFLNQKVPRDRIKLVEIGVKQADDKSTDEIKNQEYDRLVANRDSDTSHDFQTPLKDDNNKQSISQFKLNEVNGYPNYRNNLMKTMNIKIQQSNLEQKNKRFQSIQILNCKPNSQYVFNDLEYSSLRKKYKNYQSQNKEHDNSTFSKSQQISLQQSIQIQQQQQQQQQQQMSYDQQYKNVQQQFNASRNSVNQYQQFLNYYLPINQIFSHVKYQQELMYLKMPSYALFEQQIQKVVKSHEQKCGKACNHITQMFYNMNNEPLNIKQQ